MTTMGPGPDDQQRQPILYFCDESHIRTSEWMGIGGLAVTPARASLIAKEMAQLKEKHRSPQHSEVKWKKAKSKPELCKAYIDLLFRLIRDGQAHFHVRFSPFGEYDHSASGDRKETDTISKAYYQLLLHRAGRFYGQSCRILVRPDGGDCTAYLPQIMTAINADIRQRYSVPHDAITNLQPKDSKLEPMLQLLDVSLGALAAARNGGLESPELSAIKKDLAAHVLKQCGVPADHNHDASHKRLSIWNVKPKWGKGAVPAR